MRVRVKLYATLKHYVADSACLTAEEGVELAEGTTVRNVMDKLGLPDALSVLALVNGLHCTDKETILKNGDTLFFYPLMAGG